MHLKSILLWDFCHVCSRGTGREVAGWQCRDTVAAMHSLEHDPVMAHRRQLMCWGMKFRTGDGRHEAVAALEANGFNCSWTGKRLKFRQFFREMAHSQFVLSPHGHGISNHREWEALAAGSIPVVKRYRPHDTVHGLFDELPIVIVDKWAEVTPALLHSEWKRISALNAAGCTSMSRAYWPYWLGKITQYIPYTERTGVADAMHGGALEKNWKGGFRRRRRFRVWNRP